MKYPAALVCLFMFPPSLSVADGLPFRPYAIGSVAISQLKTDTTGADTTDLRDGFFTLGAGALLGPHAAVELRYLDVGSYGGSSGASTFTVKASGISLGVLGMLPVSDMLSLYGRLDAVSLRAHGELATGGVVGVGSESSNPLGFGLGVQYQLSNDVALRGHVERLHKVHFYTDKDDIDSIGMSLLGAF